MLVNDFSGSAVFQFAAHINLRFGAGASRQTAGEIAELGLRKAFVDKYFTGTASVVEGIGLFEVAGESARLHAVAFGADPVLAAGLDAGGEYHYRVRGEEHMWTPDSIAKLQHATRSGSFATYKEYAALINDQGRKLKTLRGLFELRHGLRPPVPLSEVEPAKEIVKRFATGAMSLGSISTEAHTTLAVALTLGRHAIGIELNPAYVELAQRRIAAVTPALFGL